MKKLNIAPIATLHKRGTRGYLSKTIAF